MDTLYTQGVTFATMGLPGPGFQPGSPSQSGYVSLPPAPTVAVPMPLDAWLSVASQPVPHYQQGGVRVAHIEQERWFYIRVLRDFAPVIAGMGALAGAVLGMVAGAPAMGAAWGAALLTAVPPAVMLWEYGRDLILHIRRGEPVSPISLTLRFFGGVFLPTVAVASGALWGAAISGGMALFGALAGASLLAIAGQLSLRPTQP